MHTYRLKSKSRKKGKKTGLFATFWSPALEIPALLAAILATLFAVSPALAQSGEAEIRMVHLSPDAPAVTVKVDGKPVKALSHVAYKDATSYVKLPAGPHEVTVYPTSDLTKPVLDVNVFPQANHRYTIAGVGLLSDGTFGERLFQDDTRPPDAGKVKVRVVHAVPDVGPATVGVAGGPKLFSLPGFGNASNYAEVDPGTYTFDVTVPGSKKPAFSIPKVNLKKGQTYTVFAIGRASKKTVGALITNDTKDGKIVYSKGGGTPVKDRSKLPDTSGGIEIPVTMTSADAAATNATPAAAAVGSRSTPQQPTVRPPSNASSVAIAPQQPAAATEPAATEPAVAGSLPVAATEPNIQESQPALSAVPATSAAPAQTPAVASTVAPAAVGGVSEYVAPAPVATAPAVPAPAVAAPVAASVPAPASYYPEASGAASGTVYGSVQEVSAPGGYWRPANVPAGVPPSAQVNAVVNIAVSNAGNAVASATASATVNAATGSQVTAHVYASGISSEQVGAVVSQAATLAAQSTSSLQSATGGVSLQQVPAQGAASGLPASPPPVNVPVTATVNNQAAVLNSAPRRRFVTVGRLDSSRR